MPQMENYMELRFMEDYMIKVVMSTIMLMVAVSRGLAIPAYLKKMGLMSVSDEAVKIMNTASFAIMCAALAIGAIIIPGAMVKAKRAERLELASANA